MSRPDFPRTVLEFQQQFSTEAACLKYLVESRWPDGFVCPRCGGRESYWIWTRNLIQCKQCAYQASVTAGTVLHRSKMPLRLWFYAAWLVATQTPGMSAVQFQRQVGLKNYETAFQMLHKLRAAMVKEGRERLTGVVEVDESYIGGKQHGTTGRGAGGKVTIAGAVEVRGEYAGRVRLRVIPNTGIASLTAFVKANIEEGSTVRTDGWVGYNGLRAAGYKHRPVVEGTAERASKVLPHIHRVFSNLKTWLMGTHHGVSHQHLQAYLNEFTFRFNRRKTPMAAFQTVLGLTAQRYGPTYEGLYGIAKTRAGAWVHPNPPKGG